MKRKMLSVITIIVLLVISVCACGEKNKTKSTSANGKTVFVKRICSLYSGDAEISLMFYSDEQDYSFWDMNCIEKAVLTIGKSKMDVEISELFIDERLVNGEYHQGYITIAGQLEESAGDAHLELKRKNMRSPIKYELGEYSIIQDNSEDDLDNFQFECGGVVKTATDNEVFNYGIVMRVDAEDEITIKKVDFGLDAVIIDNQNYIIYDENTYKKDILEHIENSTYDEKIETAYQRKNIEERDSSLSIKLTEGVQYIYFPLKYNENSEASMEESVVTVTYVSNNNPQKEKISSNSFTYYIEMSKSIGTIQKWFE